VTAREPLDRRERILTCAAELFARKGVAAATVREIANQVGILSGSLYHHFESKEAIVDEILSSYLDDLRARYREVLARDTDPRVRLHDLVLVSLQTVEAHPYATEIYQNDVHYLRQFDRFGYLTTSGRDVEDTWLEVIKTGIAQGAFREDLDPMVFYRLMRDAVWLSVRWFTPTQSYPISRLADECTSIFLDGLAVLPR
jgi:TetR/AcrR family transcriptional regulator, cholesterol catabolism regulator